MPTEQDESILAALAWYREHIEEEDPEIQRVQRTDPFVIASIFRAGFQAGAGS